MKKITTILACLLLCVSTAIAQRQYSAAQEKIRTDIMNHIELLGYAPSIDSDGDIKFKHEGKTYYVKVSDTDSDPFYVVLFRIHTYTETFSKEKIMNVIDKCNNKKGIKVLCANDVYYYRAEMYVTSAQTFNTVLSKLIIRMNEVSDLLSDLM